MPTAIKRDGAHAGGALLLTGGLWVLVLALFGFIPFGTKSILITDLSQQFIEYHAALYDATARGGSLLFTWNTGMGMNFIGIFAYHLSSPFTLLMYLFPREKLADAMLAQGVV